MCTLFVLLIDDDGLSSRDEFLLDLVSEVIVEVAEGEHVCIDRVVFKPFHGFEEFVVLGLQIFELELLSQNDLVECSGEVSID